nr:hypothetical protein [Tanacetum cinerariifolium]
LYHINWKTIGGLGAEMGLLGGRNECKIGA